MLAPAGIPDILWTSEREVVWATIALHREDPSRSLRSIARMVGCSHPHVARILDAWAVEPREIEAELAAAEPRYLL